MKVSEIDIQVISNLLNSIPAGMEVRSINLTNGYTLELIAGTEELYEYEKEQVLNEMINLIDTYKKLDVGQFRALKDTKLYKCIIDKE